MDGVDLREYLERLLAALERIRDELGDLEFPEPAPAVAAAPPDPWPAIAAIALAVLGTALAVAALLIAWKALRVLRELSDERALVGRRRDRAEFGQAVRRYSELLGIEAVTGRVATRGDTAASLRSGLEHRLGVDRDPGALELLAEVGNSRDGFADLPQEARTAANGLAAMSVEWSIDRWIDDPETWLRDHRERHRLRMVAARGPVGDSEPAEGDTRLL